MTAPLERRKVELLSKEEWGRLAYETMLEVDEALRALPVRPLEVVDTSLKPEAGTLLAESGRGYVKGDFGYNVYSDASEQEGAELPELDRGTTQRLFVLIYDPRQKNERGESQEIGYVRLTTTFRKSTEGAFTFKSGAGMVKDGNGKRSVFPDPNVLDVAKEVLRDPYRRAA